MKEIALKAIDDLAKKHQPEFIILYGSLVRGDYTEDSDIDVACFCKTPQQSTDIRIFEGKKLDCWVYSMADAVAEKDEFLRFVGGQVFLDAQGIGKEFLGKIEFRYRHGPDALAPDAREHLIEWSKKMLARAHGNDIDSKYRRIWLLYDLLEIYFQLRNLWFLGSKKSFHWLEENDPTAYAIFESAFSDPTDLNLLEELVRVALNTEPVEQDKPGG